ncbi:MAG: DJ-1/PfpI family protein [Alistipes sp.]|nr:DJ-1/PfpI family protein [Alistipes sp.]
METIFIFLIDGFGEIEAIATVEVLRRAELDVKTVSLTGKAVVTGSRGVPVVADMLFEEIDIDHARMLVLPGGTTAYSGHEGMKQAVRSFYDKGGKVAAICASPMVLGGLGILKGRNATCYPGFEQYLEDANLQTDLSAVVDGNVITGRGPGLTIEFALTLVEVLAGKERRDAVAGQLLVK